MKKTLLALSLAASTSFAYGATGEGCSDYINRVGSQGGSLFNFESASILSSHQAVSSAITALGATSVSAVFPYTSIILRNINGGDTIPAADGDLVKCLQTLDTKITELGEYALAGQALRAPLKIDYYS